MLSTTVFLAALLAKQALGASLLADRSTSSPPNIIFILSDDQDAQMGSEDYMPLLKKNMIDHGRAAHNTNVTDVETPYGGYPKFISGGWNDNYLPLWLQAAGYNTYYVGKLFNTHTVLNYNAPYAAGWTGNEFLLDPWQYSYYTPCFQKNQDAPITYNGSYVTDLVANKSFGFLDDALESDKPFFLTLAPIAPHGEVTINLTTYDSTFSQPQPAARHADLFPDVNVPRTLNFNPDVQSGASWIRNLPQLSSSEVAANDDWYRARLQALQAVDEMVDNLFMRLEQAGILDNTYIFYSSDNGFHISQHRLQPGKSCGYEEDINIPLVVRGPRNPEAATYSWPTSHLDLAPTFLQLAGIALHDDFDGIPIPLGGEIDSATPRLEYTNVEYWGLRSPDETSSDNVSVNNTYKSLRMIGDGYSLYYSVWCTNEHELYDMTTDPYQMNNLLGSDPTGNGTFAIGEAAVSISKLVNRLDGLLFLLKSCSGDSCREPWKQLDPTGSISTLSDALQSQYDDFFAKELPRVSYTACEAGYIISSEGPQYSGQQYVVMES